jgi:hypothetical protein
VSLSMGSEVSKATVLLPPPHLVDQDVDLNYFFNTGSATMFPVTMIIVHTVVCIGMVPHRLVCLDAWS